MSFTPIPPILGTDLSTAAGDVVLDLGCGDGRWTTRLRTLAPYVMGLDVSAMATGAAVCGDVLELPIRRESCSLVIAANLLRHLRDPTEALRRWRRVLKPAGVLWILEDEPALDNEPGALYRDLQRLMRAISSDGRGDLMTLARFQTIVTADHGWMSAIFENKETLNDEAPLLQILDKLGGNGVEEASRLAAGIRQGHFAYGRGWWARWTGRAGG